MYGANELFTYPFTYLIQSNFSKLKNKKRSVTSMYMTGFNSFMDVLPYLCGGQAKVCTDDKIPVDDG